MLESFFIFSLAIMFILVGLLLYHIRGRMNASEQRIDTLFEMTSKLTNEINATRVHIANLKYASGGELSCAAENIIPFQPSIGGGHSIAVKKIVVSDDEVDEDYDSEDDDDDDIIVEDNYNSESDADTDADEEPAVSEVEPDVDIDISELPIEDVTVPPEEIEPIVSMEIVPDSDSEVDASEVATEDLDYSKMNLPVLKKVATERGIASPHDLSAMKKKDIIALLTAAK